MSQYWLFSGVETRITVKYLVSVAAQVNVENSKFTSQLIITTALNGLPGSAKAECPTWRARPRRLRNRGPAAASGIAACLQEEILKIPVPSTDREEDVFIAKQHFRQNIILTVQRRTRRLDNAQEGP